MTDEEKSDGINEVLTVGRDVLHEGDEFIVTVTPTSNWYAIDLENDVIGNKGEPLSYTVTCESDDNLGINVLIIDTGDPTDPDTCFLSVNIGIGPE